MNVRLAPPMDNLMDDLTHPITLGIALVACDVLLWRLIPAVYRRVRIVVRLVVFLLLTAVLLKGGMSPLENAPFPGQPARRLPAQALQLVWWFLGARVLTVTLHALFLPKAWQAERLFQDLLGALIFVAAAVAATAYVLELPVSGLLATSGALAIVVGLAIQSSLGDVFSGLVLNATQPFHIGDWVSIDGVDGKVVQINWRATHLLNARGNLVVIPNSTTAKAKIVNSSRPSELHGISVSIEVDPAARPKAVLDALEHAVRHCRMVLPTPEPSVLVKSAGTNSIVYEISGYVESMANKPIASNQLFDLAHRHLSSADIGLRALGVPGIPGIPGVPEQRAPGADRRVRLLASVGIFHALGGEELEHLARHLTRHEYAPGQVVVASSDVTDYLLLVDSGVLTVHAQHEGQPLEINRLGPGDALGEPGVLAGIAMDVTVEAITPAVLYRLDKADLTPVLQSRPEIGRKMCQLLTRRRESGQMLASARPPQAGKTSILQWLQDKMQSLHHLTDDWAP